MKKVIMASIMTILFVANVYAGDFAVENPGLSPEGNEVTMKVSIKDASLTQQVKVLFHGNTTGFTENATLQPYYDWYVGNDNNKTTLTDMYKDGWVLKQIIPYNATAAKQFYIILIK